MDPTNETQATALQAIFDQFNWIDQNRIAWYERATTDAQRDKIRKIYWDANHLYDLSLTLAFKQNDAQVAALTAQVKAATDAARNALASLQNFAKVLTLVKQAVDLAAGFFL